ncbi:MAG: hypothetical protein QM811_24780 [Pirellulales bacterium]
MKAARSAKAAALRWIGSGEVCADYLTIPCDPADRADVAEALATHLSERDDWDSAGTRRRTRRRCDGRRIGRRPGRTRSRTRRRLALFGLADRLTGGWDGFMAGLSKSYRRNVRRRLEEIESGEFSIRIANTPAEYDAAWTAVVELHTKRRTSLGIGAASPHGVSPRCMRTINARCGRAARSNWSSSKPTDARSRSTT